MEYPSELKERVGLWLQTAPHGSQKLIAQALGITPRALRSWQKLGQRKNESLRGRKKVVISFKEKLAIARELKKQGYPGSRPVIKALPNIRVRAAREVIRELKMRRKKRFNIIKLEVRRQIHVSQAGVLLAMDGATIERGTDFIVYRDRGSLRTSVTKCGDNLNSLDTLGVLENLKQQNRLPFVVGTDNGSPFCSDIVEDFLEKNYIVHLKNLPQTPEHNGSCENAVREFKELFAYDPDAKRVTQTLNEHRLRQKLNWQTSLEFEENNFSNNSIENRREFFEKTKSNIKNALDGIKSAYQKRRIEREEILKTMQDFSLITITRGNQTRQTKAEEIA